MTASTAMQKLVYRIHQIYFMVSLQMVLHKQQDFLQAHCMNMKNSCKRTLIHMI